MVQFHQEKGKHTPALNKTLKADKNYDQTPDKVSDSQPSTALTSHVPVTHMQTSSYEITHGI